MVIGKIISLGIKHIVIINVQWFLYLSIKVYSFVNFLSLSNSLNCTILIAEEKFFFQYLWRIEFPMDIPL